MLSLRAIRTGVGAALAAAALLAHAAPSRATPGLKRPRCGQPATKTSTGSGRGSRSAGTTEWERTKSLASSPATPSWSPNRRQRPPVVAAEVRPGAAEVRPGAAEVVERSVVGPPAVAQPAGGQRVLGRLAAGRPEAERPEAERPGGTRAAGQRVAGQRAAAPPAAAPPALDGQERPELHSGS